MSDAKVIPDTNVIVAASIIKNMGELGIIVNMIFTINPFNYSVYSLIQNVLMDMQCPKLKPNVSEFFQEL